jgi:hypothetical protein
VWNDTAVELPKEYVDPVKLKSVLDGKAVPSAKAGGRIIVRLADALAHFPVGLLTLVMQP